MKTRRTLAAASIALLALAAGCANSAATAATVGGVVIPDSEIARASAAAAPVEQKGSAVLGPAVAQAEIQGIIAAQIAAEKKIELTDAARASIIAANPLLATLAASVDGATLANRLADTQIVASKVSPDDFSAACAKTVVKVNPRYGNWVKEMCGFDGNSGSLSGVAPNSNVG